MCIAHGVCMRMCVVCVVCGVCVCVCVCCVCVVCALYVYVDTIEFVHSLCVCV